MNQKYKVLCAGGIDLAGRRVKQGQTFDPKDEFNEWCETLVRRGNLARVGAPSATSEKA